MGYKKMKQNLGFADLTLASSAKHNRSLKNMVKFNNAIDWLRVDAILINHYTVGTSEEGARAYPPLLLLKFLLLQKLFHIDSDPELENQINDRLSCKNSWPCLSLNLRRITQLSPVLEQGFPQKPWIRSTLNF